MHEKKIWEEVSYGEGQEYLPVRYREPKPEESRRLSHGYSTPLAAHREFCRLLPWDEKHIKLLEETWEDEVLPFLERVYGKRG